MSAGEQLKNGCEKEDRIMKKEERRKEKEERRAKIEEGRRKQGQIITNTEENKQE